MAYTTFATGNSLTVKKWTSVLAEAAQKETFFDKYKDSGIVMDNTDLSKGQGDQVYFPYVNKLSGTGVTHTQDLKGNEESLADYNFSISLEEYAHAVLVRSNLETKRASFSIPGTAQEMLKKWMTEKQDSLCFDAFYSNAANSYTKALYTVSGTLTGTTTRATAYNAVTSTDKLTPELISAAKAWAVTGGGRAFEPIRPVSFDGRKYLVLLVYPDALYDLKLDSTFAQARREAENRGKDNPIFSGATAIWDGVIIKENEFVNTGTNTGAVPYSECLLLGQGALARAYGKQAEVVQVPDDYERKTGYAIKATLAVGASNFNSKTYGSMLLTVANTAIKSL
jgi:N4-gp56 family major capsid protein